MGLTNPCALTAYLQPAAGQPLWARLEKLEIGNSRLYSGDIDAFLRATQLPRLRVLGLSGSPLDVAGPTPLPGPPSDPNPRPLPRAALAQLEGLDLGEVQLCPSLLPLVEAWITAGACRYLLLGLQEDAAVEARLQQLLYRAGVARQRTPPYED